MISAEETKEEEVRVAEEPPSASASSAAAPVVLPAAASSVEPLTEELLDFSCGETDVEGPPVTQGSGAAPPAPSGGEEGEPSEVPAALSSGAL